MKFYSRIAAFALACVLMLGAAGCSGADTSWTHRLEDDTLAAGVYLMYMLDAYAELETQYRETLPEEERLTAKIKLGDIRKFEVDGKTGDAWIAEKAQSVAYQHYGLTERFDSLGLSLSPEDEGAIRSEVNGYWSYISKYYEANGVSENSLIQFLLEEKMKESLFAELYGEGGELEADDEELMAAFAEEYVKVQYISVPKFDLEGQPKDEAAAKAQAEGYLQRLKDGEAFEDVLFDRDTAEAAEGQDIVKQEPDANAMVLTESDAIYYGTLGEGALAVTMEEPLLEENDDYYYIFVKRDILEDPETFENYRNTMLGKVKYDEYEAMLEQWGKDRGPTVNQEAIGRYKTSNLKTDYNKYVS